MLECNTTTKWLTAAANAWLQPWDHSHILQRESLSVQKLNTQTWYQETSSTMNCEPSISSTPWPLQVPSHPHFPATHTVLGGWSSEGDPAAYPSTANHRLFPAVSTSPNQTGWSSTPSLQISCLCNIENQLFNLNIQVSAKKPLWLSDLFNTILSFVKLGLSTNIQLKKYSFKIVNWGIFRPAE